MKHPITELTPTECRKALAGFWNDACAMEPVAQGLVLTLPILLEDGWQATVYLEPEMEGCVALRDRGQMNSWLISRGVDIYGKWFRKSSRVLMERFGIMEDERGYFKMQRLPLDACEIQLFGAFLSSLSHHVLGMREESVQANQVAFSNTLAMVRSLKLHCTRRQEIETQFRKMTVDITCDGPSCSAILQTFDRSKRMRENFELWSSRLQEIRESSDRRYQCCMVYDEDGGSLTPPLLQMARKRGNEVIPCHRQDELADFLRGAVV